MDDNDDTFLEQRKFRLSVDMETTRNQVSRTLGFTTDLPHTRVKLMYDMCRFKKAFEPEKVSPWCAAFSTENLKVSWDTYDVRRESIMCGVDVITVFNFNKQL